MKRAKGLEWKPAMGMILYAERRAKKDTTILDECKDYMKRPLKGSGGKGVSCAVEMKGQVERLTAEPEEVRERYVK